MNSIAVIEGIRSGVPTKHTTTGLPDLRPETREEFKRSLQEEGSSEGTWVWGKYGQGKSHFLRTIEHDARNAGYATSYVTLNRSLSPHNLLDIYSQAAQSVRLPDTSIPGIAHSLSRKRRTDLPVDFELSTWRGWNLPSIVLYALIENSEPEYFHTLYSYLVGSKSSQALVNTAIKSSIPFGFRPSSITLSASEKAKAWFDCFAFATRLCGCKGWIILIDEAELTARLGRIGRMKAFGNLAWLMQWDKQDLHDHSFRCYVGAATSLMDFWTRTNAAGESESSLSIQLASLHVPGYDEVLRDFFQRVNSSSSSVQLPRPTPHSERLLLEAIREHHGRAYSWEPPPLGYFSTLMSSFNPDDPPRLKIRGLLEVLDVKRFTSKEPVVHSVGLSEADLMSLSDEVDEEVFANLQDDDEIEV